MMSELAERLKIHKAPADAIAAVAELEAEVKRRAAELAACEATLVAENDHFTFRLAALEIENVKLREIADALLARQYDLVRLRADGRAAFLECVLCGATHPDEPGAFFVFRHANDCPVTLAAEQAKEE